MLYSTTIKIKNKEYDIKIGMGELIKLQKLGINILNNNSDMEDTIRIMITCIKDCDMFKDLSLDESIEKFIEYFDNDSELTVRDITESITRAIYAGLFKKDVSNKLKKSKDKKESKN